MRATGGRGDPSFHLSEASRRTATRRILRQTGFVITPAGRLVLNVVGPIAQCSLRPGQFPAQAGGVVEPADHARLDDCTGARRRSAAPPPESGRNDGISSPAWRDGSRFSRSGVAGIPVVAALACRSHSPRPGWPKHPLTAGFDPGCVARPFQGHLPPRRGRRPCAEPPRP